MKHRIRYVVLILLVGLGLGFTLLQGPAISERTVAQDVSTPATVASQRLVSLAPSITESLFALGLGDRVVGVTNFCDYPPEALDVPKIGGYYDLNLEAVLGLGPDLVVCLPEHAAQLEHLDDLGLSHLTVDHRHVETILESLLTLGQTCGVEDRAEEMVQGLRQRIQAVQAGAAGQKPPRVLVCVGRNMGSATIDEVYVAGPNGFYDEMISLAGGVNAYQGDQPYPMMTAEGLLRTQPDLIFDMVADLEEQGLTEEDVLQQWQSLSDLKAVQQGRVVLFTEDFVVIPGPRFVQILEKMARALAPAGVTR